MRSSLNDEIKYWLALNRFSKFGPARFRKLLDHFGSPAAAFGAAAGELKAAGIEAAVAEEFIAARTSIEPERLLETLEKEGIGVTTLNDENYPKRLKEIYDPPPLLFFRGRLEPDDETALAVVGTRRPTLYGKQAAEEFAGELARRQITIVSGLALGVDSIAHQAAITAGGRTVAVLGSGLDRENIYPASNRYLANKIAAEGGLLFSEFALGTPPLKHNFPQRNRIISGLSLGVLVIEAGERSGSLITAKFALEQDREVFAVPGSIYSPLSLGANLLIKRGAAAVTGTADILDALDLSEVTAYIDKQIENDTPEEGRILSFLNREPAHIDRLAALTGLPIAKVSGALMTLEMKGRAKNLGGMMYILGK